VRGNPEEICNIIKKKWTKGAWFEDQWCTRPLRRGHGNFQEVSKKSRQGRGRRIESRIRCPKKVGEEKREGIKAL